MASMQLRSPRQNLHVGGETMSLQLVAQVLGALGVISSFVYAAIQVRRNTRAVRAGAYLQATGAFAQTWLEFGRNPQMVDLILRAGDDFNALERQDKARFRFAMMGYLRQVENAFFLHRIGILKESDWQGVVGDMRALISLPGMRAAWPMIRHVSGDDFRAHVQGLVNDFPAAPAPEPAAPPPPAAS
jgi:hypothetical protein